jgi:TPR repeat protein
MFRIGLLGALTLWAGAAFAADQPEYAPPGAWVKPAAIPAAPVATDGAPVQTLLVDQQSRLGADSDDLYVERALRIASPEGLNISSALGKTWDPDTETLVIHRLNIIRGDKVIDVLAGGKKFIVLRRENNLELAMLDGRLTATIQPEGLEVGDIVDIATTLRRHDPALQGYSSDADGLTHTGVASRIRMRAIWPASKPIRWRVTDGLDAPKVAKTADGSELVIDMANAETPKPPAGAPLRFADLGSLELSQFAGWPELSRLMSPLYQKAATIPPDSPLAAEVAKIAAASADPKVRATMALRLVEDQTRYVFLGMNDGGLVPADALATWSRRFGDCKGKSVMLLAVLRALGVQAEPALVSTVFGDGLDQHMPMAGWFDHVIVRAQIGDKTYWLDGTRVGDRNIDDLVVPPFRWALPLRPAGADLVRLDPAPLTEPGTEEVMKIDASKGPTSPAPTHIEFLYRGENAVLSRQGLASVPRADFDRYLREFWTKSYPWLEVSKVDETDDPTANVVRLTADGVATLDWTLTADGSRYYRVPQTAMGGDVSFKRQPGLHQDAPYSVAYPYFEKRSKQIVLPTDGDFLLVGEDIDKTAAGLAFRRTARIDRGVLSIELTTRSIAREFPASQAEADGEALRQMAKNGVSIAYRTAATGSLSTPASPASPADQTAAERGDPAAQFRLGQMYGQGRGVPLDAALAMSWFRKAADQGYGPAQGALGAAYFSGVGEPRDYAQALIWLRKGAAQDDVVSETDLALMYASGAAVPRDDAQAFVWAQKAAAHDVAGSEVILGSLYLQGTGAPKDVVKAIAWFRKAADQGLPAAEVRLAAAYHLGIGLTRDDKQAVAWARKAADQGDASGQDFLGDLYRHGDGVAQDFAQAMVWYRKAADQGDPNGALNVAGLYGDGLGVPKDTAQAYDWVRKAANQGLADAQFKVGRLYADGHGVTQDDAQAADWWRKAANQGHRAATIALGTAYLQGRGVAKDSLQAAAWYMKGAVQGDAVAQFDIGLLYLRGNGVAEDGTQALNWLTKSADQGYAPAMAALGKVYVDGLAGVTPARDKGLALFRRAADQGWAPAAAELGRIYSVGGQTPPDMAQAFVWIHKAAELGSADAQLSLGSMYLNGKGVAADPAQAVVWIRKAVQQGLPRAQLYLAGMYDVGHGVPLDQAQANAWFLKAAENGDAQAQMILGVRYHMGMGVARDDAAAFAWTRKAADQGNVQAETSIGLAYMTGKGLPADDGQAFAFLSKAGPRAMRTPRSISACCTTMGAASRGTSARPWPGTASPRIGAMRWP